ncbi:response regulator, partial [Halorhodospira sp. 9622]|uniref:response regulator n=1 Tax=Halorhodospira sp. 9622 TaxID=2899136 RepID=UPI001EE8394F
TAPSGNAALEAYRNDAFDLLLLDLHMPELDGIQVAQAVRAIEQEQGLHRMAIALCTAYAREDAEGMAPSAIFDAYLGKPVSRRDLCDLVRWITRSQS